MQTRHIGNDQVGRVEVGAIGLGLMTFDQTGTQPREQLLDTVRAALDAGVTLFDTADAYGPEIAERLICEALHAYPAGLVIATKGGITRQGPARRNTSAAQAT